MREGDVIIVEAFHRLANGIKDFLLIMEVFKDKRVDLKSLQEGFDTTTPDAIAIIHIHAGLLDRDLYKLSSFSAVRPMEAGFLCSEELKNFIKEHNIELVNYSIFD